MRMMNKKFKSYEIFNICSNNPVNIKKVVSYLYNKIKFNKIKIIKDNKYEVLKTHGSNYKINKFVNYKKYSNLYMKIDKIIEWYKKNYRLI